MGKKNSIENRLKEIQYSDAGNLNARIRLHQRYSTTTQSWSSFVLQHLHLKPAETVLELGCGNAAQTRQNKLAYPQPLRYILADFSPGMLEEAKPDLHEDPRFLLTTQDAQALALPARSFDLVTANHMLYHVPDIAAALNEIYRLLKPGGRLMAATNGKGHMHDLDRLLASIPGFDPSLHQFHSRFTLEEGFNLIHACFGNCELVPYPGDLWVTNAQDLCDYVLSMRGIRSEFQSQTKEQLTRFFEERIRDLGGIRIRKSTGLLLAKKDLV